MTVITFVVGLVVTFLFSRALWATICFLPMIYFVLDLAFTFLSQERLSAGKRVLLQLAITAVLGFLGWHFYLQNQYRAQQAAMLEGDLTPAKAVLAENPTIQVGNSGGSFSFSSAAAEQRSLPPWVYRAGLQVSEGREGVSLTTSIKDREGNEVVTIKDNHWIVYPHYCSDKNYTDNSLEVKDSSGDVVLQVVLVGSTAQLQGIWRDPFGAGEELVTSDNRHQSTVASWQNAAEEERNEKQISPMFIYPSSQHWGVELSKLTVDDFDSTQGITITNSSSKPMTALNVNFATDMGKGSASYPLNIKIAPHETRSVKFSIPSAIRILSPTTGSFQDQWKEANETYKGCIDPVFFSPFNSGFGTIIRSSRAAHVTLPLGYGVGTIAYKPNGTQPVTTTKFNLVALLGLQEGCHH